MEKDLVSGNLGEHGKYDLAISGTNLIVKGGYEVGPIKAGVDVSLGLEAIVLLLKNTLDIPGTQIDNFVWDLILAELKKV